MLYPFLIKPITDKIIKESNRYIRATVDDYFRNFPDVQTYAKAVGAYSLAIAVCSKLGIDAVEIEKPDNYLDFLRKEKYLPKNLNGGK